MEGLVGNEENEYPVPDPNRRMIYRPMSSRMSIKNPQRENHK
jgi:hypothetical protein